MSKHRSRKTSKRRKSETSNNLSVFFDTILPFIENLEKEDKLLLVLPGIPERGTATHPESQEEHSAPLSPALTQGIVISSDLAADINLSYVTTMAANVRHCGTLEAYYSFIQRNPKWAASHNPDQLLLNICRAARLVIAYRYGLALGNAEYIANDNDDDTLRYDDDNPENSNNRNVEKSSSSSSLSLDPLPLFITMMSDEGSPQSIGYELGGIITLEEYKGTTNDTNHTNE